MTTLHRASQCWPTCTCVAGCGAHWSCWCSHSHAADFICVMKGDAHCYLLCHTASIIGNSGERCFTSTAVMLVITFLCCKMFAFLCQMFDYLFWHPNDSSILH